MEATMQSPYPFVRKLRGLAAIELRNAAALRRDLALGLLPRRPALTAHRDCLRHAAWCRRDTAALPAGA